MTQSNLSVKIIKRFMSEKEFNVFMRKYDNAKLGWGGATLNLERAKKMWDFYKKTKEPVSLVAKHFNVCIATVYRAFAAVMMEKE